MSLRDRLAVRARPTTTYGLRVDDDTTARAELVAAQADGDAERVAAARAAVHACYEQLLIRALPPTDMEALLEAHPPTKTQRDRGAVFDPVTFVPALLTACVESDITVDDWSDYTTKGPLTQGETTALFTAVWELNYRAPDPDLPKG